MAITQSGDPITAGDEEHTLRFTGLNYDWVAVGRTVTLRVLSPENTTPIDFPLSVVAGDANAAEITNIDGAFNVDGVWKAQLRLYEGSTFIRASVLTLLNIYETI